MCSSDLVVGDTVREGEVALVPVGEFIRLPAQVAAEVLP